MPQVRRKSKTFFAWPDRVCAGMCEKLAHWSPDNFRSDLSEILPAWSSLHWDKWVKVSDQGEMRPWELTETRRCSFLHSFIWKQNRMSQQKPNRNPTETQQKPKNAISLELRRSTEKDTFGKKCLKRRSRYLELSLAKLFDCMGVIGCVWKWGNTYWENDDHIWPPSGLGGAPFSYKPK